MEDLRGHLSQDTVILPATTMDQNIDVTETGATDLNDQNDQTEPTDQREQKDQNEEEDRTEVTEATEATGIENAETETAETDIGNVTVVIGIVVIGTEIRTDAALALQDTDHPGRPDVIIQKSQPHRVGMTGIEIGISAVDMRSHRVDMADDRNENGTTENVDHEGTETTVEGDQNRMIVVEGNHFQGSGA